MADSTSHKVVSKSHKSLSLEQTCGLLHIRPYPLDHNYYEHLFFMADPSRRNLLDRYSSVLALARKPHVSIQSVPPYRFEAYISSNEFVYISYDDRPHHRESAYEKIAHQYRALTEGDYQTMEEVVSRSTICEVAPSDSWNATDINDITFDLKQIGEPIPKSAVMNALSQFRVHQAAQQRT